MGEVVTFVRIPIHEIEQWVRGKHLLPKTMIDVRLESDFLVLYFSDRDRDSMLSTGTSASLPLHRKRKRKAHHRRHRTKTRGWEIVSRFTNKKGQTCAIYKPFVDALSRPLSDADQKMIVAKILKANGNKPSDATVNYFLENTLEYLSNVTK